MSRTIEVKFTDRPALSNSILLLTMMFFSATAFADKPEWAGRGDDGEKSYKHEKKHEKGVRNTSRIIIILTMNTTIETHCKRSLLEFRCYKNHKEIIHTT